MPKIDPWKFVEKDKFKNELRPALGGVYYKNGYLYASDAMVALKSKYSYPKSYEGKILDKNGNQILSNGNPVVRFPNVDAILPDMKKSDEFVIDIKALENALSKVTRPKRGEAIGKKLVIYPEGYSEKELVNSQSPSTFLGSKGRSATPGLATYNAWMFKRSILPFMKAAGANRIFMDRGRSDARGTLITNGVDMALIMPLQNYNPDEALKEPETIVYKTKEVGLIPKSINNKKDDPLRKMVSSLKQKSKNKELKPKTTMKPIKIKGVEYDRLAVAGTKEKALSFAKEYLHETEMPYTDTNGRVHRANGYAMGIFILNKSGRWYMLRPVNQETEPSAKTVERKSSKGRGKLGDLVEKVTEKFNDIFHRADASIIVHIEHVAKSGEAKDLYKRIAWDVARAAKYQSWDFLPKDRQGFITATDSELSTLFVQAIKKSDIDKYIKREIKTKKTTVMTRKKTTTKAHGSSTTMRDASRILKAQKDDYQKIFRAEVKKSKDPKAGAKKAGKIYRDRYGATATARWKKALKCAK